MERRMKNSVDAVAARSPATTSEHRLMSSPSSTRRRYHADRVVVIARSVLGSSDVEDVPTAPAPGVVHRHGSCLRRTPNSRTGARRGPAMHCFRSLRRLYDESELVITPLARATSDRAW